MTTLDMLQFTDIQGSLEAAPSGPSVGMAEGHTRGGSPSEPMGSSPSPALSPETSAGQLQGEASQSSVGTASGTCGKHHMMGK